MKTKLTHWTTEKNFAYVTKKTSKFVFFAFNLLFLRFVDKIEIIQLISSNIHELKYGGIA